MMRNFVISVLLLFTAADAYGSSRFALLAGFGNGASTKDATFNEGPLMLMLKLDVDYRPKWVLGLEHSRAIGSDDEGQTSDISETSFGVRYHFLNSASFMGYNQSKSDDVHFSVSRRSISPYIGANLGFASSGSKDELRAANNVFSVTVKLKGGMHWQLSDSYGLDFDASYSIPVAGNGEIIFITAGLGFYVNF